MGDIPNWSVPHRLTEKDNVMQRIYRFMVLIALAVTAVVCAVPAIADDGSTVILDYQPTANPVADRTVHLDVNKLDRDTHEFVKGAHLQIIDKETGEVKADWISDGTTQESARELDVDRNYILHEVEAPAGYEKAEDVEFILRSVNFETKGEVISGAQTSDGQTNAEFNNVSGDIETQAFVISLYDKASPAERTITETRERPSENNTQNQNEKQQQNTNTTKQTTSTQTTNVQSGTVTISTRSGGGSLTQTSDDTSYVPIIVIVVAAIGIIGFAIYKRRK